MTATKAMELAVRIFDATKLCSKNTLVAFINFALLDVGQTIKGAVISEIGRNCGLSLSDRRNSDSESARFTPIIEVAAKAEPSRAKDDVVAALVQHSPEVDQL